VNFYHKILLQTVLITQVNFISDYQKAHELGSSSVCGSRTWETESIHPITKRQQLRGRKNKGLLTVVEVDPDEVQYSLLWVLL
jgi:hypothetical protein